MTRVRVFLLVPAAVAVLLAAPMGAHAHHCDDLATMPDDWCHQSAPPPSRAPTPTPKPSATPAPSQAPASQAPAPRPFVQPTAQPFSGVTPAPSSSIEVDIAPEFIDDVPTERIDTVRPTASLSAWIFGFFVGLIVGLLVGRASWGVSRRRRKQQIFG